jgi:hypothetical protein
VQGSLRSREYETDGAKQRMMELRADTIGKLDRGKMRRRAKNGQCSFGLMIVAISRALWPFTSIA